VFKNFSVITVPLRSPRHEWEHNIRMDLREIRWEGVGWIHLAQNRDQWCAVVSMVMNLQVPQNAVNVLTI